MTPTKSKSKAIVVSKPPDVDSVLKRFKALRPNHTKYKLVKVPVKWRSFDPDMKLDITLRTLAAPALTKRNDAVRSVNSLPKAVIRRKSGAPKSKA